MFISRTSLLQLFRKSGLLQLALLLFLLLLTQKAKAQHRPHVGPSFIPITGQVKDQKGIPLQGVSIHIKDLKIGTFTDATGRFELQLPFTSPEQIFKLLFSYVGYKTVHREVAAADHTTASNMCITLEKEREDVLEDVSVLGRSVGELTNRQSYNVTSIDAEKLHNSTLDIAQVLDRVSGVRVRESGGVGSDFTFSLNGFSGGRVKFFIDGIPMDDLGSSFQINNIPVNLAERVEVYKGVVPIWLGADALGGAVNIVTGNKRANYIDASYSIGSFNTHKTNISAAFTAKKGIYSSIERLSELF